MTSSCMCAWRNTVCPFPVCPTAAAWIHLPCHHLEPSIVQLIQSYFCEADAISHKEESHLELFRTVVDLNCYDYDVSFSQIQQTVQNVPGSWKKILTGLPLCFVSKATSYSPFVRFPPPAWQRSAPDRIPALSLWWSGHHCDKPTQTHTIKNQVMEKECQIHTDMQIGTLHQNNRERSLIYALKGNHQHCHTHAMLLKRQ